MPTPVAAPSQEDLADALFEEIGSSAEGLRRFVWKDLFEWTL
jgi:hypothetical protein